ncbi:MAG: kinase-like domain-containing protein [Monoraphidium minutum]|nr:MAG: kinase-like domain-containing protein [Monoraphidium minutum]
MAATWSVDVTDKGCMDYDKRTPLHISAAEGAFSVAQWLLDSGADPNPLDRHNRTPLEEAVRNDHVEVVRLLQAHRGRVMEEGSLVALDQSRLKGLVNTRSEAMQDIGWDPEWEVNPKELRLIERIGGGEFGEVYKAKWHGSYVAAKVLKRSDEIALGDFRTEIAILRKIHHPNCVQFLGACTKQKPYIVLTELMACSLADAFQKTFYAPTQRRQVEIALDFARGMAYLHSRRQPIVHRDLKPANLMISGNLNADAEQLYLDSGVIKVADFGLSKSLVPVDRHGQMTMAINQVYKLTGETGSYRYMAPEVFRHEPYNLKVDVYSFAMIIFQLFETTVPFAGHDPVDAARQAAMLGARPGFPPRKATTAMTDALRRIVDDCWNADPEARPSFEDVVGRLEALLATLPKHSPYSKGQGECCAVQ